MHSKVCLHTPCSCVISLTYYRAFYSEDWCRQHPEGTVGEFNRDFDFLDPKVLQVRHNLFIQVRNQTNIFLAI